MQTIRKFELVDGRQTMISLTVGISRDLQLEVTNTQESLLCGVIALVIINGGERIAIHQTEVRAIAQAFTFLADMLDVEAKNDRET